MAEISVHAHARRKGEGLAWGIVLHHVIANRRMEVFESKVIIDMNIDSHTGEYLAKLRERAKAFGAARERLGGPPYNGCWG